MLSYHDLTLPRVSFLYIFIFWVVLNHQITKWLSWIKLGHSWCMPAALFATMIADTFNMMVGAVRYQINTNSSSITMIAKQWLWYNAKHSTHWTSHKGLKYIMFKRDHGRAATRRVSYLGFGFLREITIRKCPRTARLFYFGVLEWEWINIVWYGW